MPNNPKDEYTQKFVISFPSIVFDLMRRYLSLQTLASQIVSFMINATMSALDSLPQMPFLSCLPDAVLLSLQGVIFLCVSLTLSSLVVSFSDSGLWNKKSPNFCFLVGKTFEHLCVPSLNPSQFYYVLLKMRVMELHTVFNLWINPQLIQGHNGLDFALCSFSNNSYYSVCSFDFYWALNCIYVTIYHNLKILLEW